MRHVGQELGLVAVRAEQFDHFLIGITLGCREVGGMLAQAVGMLFELYVALLELGLLGFQPRLRFAQLRALRHQLLVGNAQFFLLGLQLLRLRLRFLEQVFALAAQHPSAQGDGDGLRETFEQFDFSGSHRMQEAELEDAVHHIVGLERRDQQGVRLPFAERG
jgi:hypothetical protein